MSAHTPGPWTWDSKRITSAIPNHAFQGRWLVADIPAHRLGSSDNRPKDEQREANARLIEAAPEMYRNAKDTVYRLADLPRWLRDNGANTLARIVAEELAQHRAAIAKAEGRAEQ